MCGKHTTRIQLYLVLQPLFNKPSVCALQPRHLPAAAPRWACPAAGRQRAPRAALRAGPGRASSIFAPPAAPPRRGAERGLRARPAPLARGAGSADLPPQRAAPGSMPRSGMRGGAAAPLPGERVGPGARLRGRGCGCVHGRTEPPGRAAPRRRSCGAFGTAPAGISRVAAARSSLRWSGSCPRGRSGAGRGASPRQVKLGWGRAAARRARCGHRCQLCSAGQRSK